MVHLKRWLQRRSPYQSLAILLVPVAVVEPAKLGAVAVAGTGHWFTGAVVILLAYALSIFVVERLFAILKPSLLTLVWLAKAWNCFLNIRARTMTFFCILLNGRGRGSRKT